MRLISGEDLDRLLNFPSLIDRLHEAFVGRNVAPPRRHHEIGHNGEAVHLLMPAWTENTPDVGAFLGTKIVNVFRGNGSRGLPAVLGTYVLQSGETGAPLAVMDGTRLTHWRTAAASALAARFLARPEAHSLLMVGAGALAPFLIRAHAAVRPITKVTLWNHRVAGAEALALTLSGSAFDVTVTTDLEAAVQDADVISCATLSGSPLVRGAWLRPGQHIDLVGAFTLAMRETDGDALRLARVFIDTEDATVEGGDVAIALRDGVIQHSDLQGTLHDLCRQNRPGRTGADEITLFKSTGSAIEDLAAAILAWERLSSP
jgi:ornithine cyclodeaminase